LISYVTISQAYYTMHNTEPSDFVCNVAPLLREQEL
jgi:hypothetical protein